MKSVFIRNKLLVKVKIVFFWKLTFSFVKKKRERNVFKDSSKVIEKGECDFKMALKKLGATGRFGSRYGFGIKKRLLKIESALKTKQKCPYCMKKSVKRIASGIWYCTSCKTKFAGKAYSPETKL